MLFNAQCKLADYLFKLKFDEQLAIELPRIKSQIIQSPFCTNKHARYEKYLTQTKQNIIGKIDANLEHVNIYHLTVKNVCQTCC